MRRGKHKILMSVNKTNLREKRHNNDNDTKAIYFVGRVEVTYKSHEFMVSLVKCQSISFVIISINIADVIIFHKLLLLRKYFDEYKMRNYTRATVTKLRNKIVVRIADLHQFFSSLSFEISEFYSRFYYIEAFFYSKFI